MKDNEESKQEDEDKHEEDSNQTEVVEKKRVYIRHKLIKDFYEILMETKDGRLPPNEPLLRQLSDMMLITVPKVSTLSEPTKQMIKDFQELLNTIKHIIYRYNANEEVQHAFLHAFHLLEIKTGEQHRNQEILIQRWNARDQEIVQQKAKRRADKIVNILRLFSSKKFHKLLENFSEMLAHVTDKYKKKYIDKKVGRSSEESYIRDNVIANRFNLIAAIFHKHPEYKQCIEYLIQCIYRLIQYQNRKEYLDAVNQFNNNHHHSNSDGNHDVNNNEKSENNDSDNSSRAMFGVGVKQDDLSNTNHLIWQETFSFVQNWLGEQYSLAEFLRAAETLLQPCSSSSSSSGVTSPVFSAPNLASPNLVPMGVAANNSGMMPDAHPGDNYPPPADRMINAHPLSPLLGDGMVPPAMNAVASPNFASVPSPAPVPTPVVPVTAAIPAAYPPVIPIPPPVVMVNGVATSSNVTTVENVMTSPTTGTVYPPVDVSYPPAEVLYPPTDITYPPASALSSPSLSSDSQSDATEIKHDEDASASSTDPPDYLHVLDALNEAASEQKQEQEQEQAALDIDIDMASGIASPVNNIDASSSMDASGGGITEVPDYINLLDNLVIQKLTSESRSVTSDPHLVPDNSLYSPSNNSMGNHPSSSVASPILNAGIPRYQEHFELQHEISNYLTFLENLGTEMIRKSYNGFKKKKLADEKAFIDATNQLLDHHFEVVSKFQQQLHQLIKTLGDNEDMTELKKHFSSLKSNIIVGTTKPATSVNSENSENSESEQDIPVGHTDSEANLLAEDELYHIRPEILADLPALVHALMCELKSINLPPIDLSHEHYKFIVQNAVLEFDECIKKPYTFKVNSKEIEKDGVYYQIIDVDIKSLHMKIKDIYFFFDKTFGFPNYCDSGIANMVVGKKGMNIKLRLRVDLSECSSSRPTFEILDCKCSISSVKLDLQQTNHDFLFSLLSPILNVSIKPTIEEFIQYSIIEFVLIANEFLSDIFKSGDSVSMNFSADTVALPPTQQEYFVSQTYQAYKNMFLSSSGHKFPFYPAIRQSYAEFHHRPLKFPQNKV